jgi:hypothetical protein
MRVGKTLGVSLIITAAVWGWLTWPLPAFVSRGIPSSSENIEVPSHRAMIEGDHLQLMYHFWLFSDMLRGETPWFHNVYEFNTGNDEDRKTPDPFYFPFSLVFALIYYAGGMALAWNVTGFVSLWLSYAATWLLVSAIVNDWRVGAVLGVLSVLLPYRWMSLLGGSPTGFAMLWVPLLMLGVEASLRRRKAWGGWVTALALLCAIWTDLHVFFFSGLLLPPWALVCLLMPVPSAGRVLSAEEDEANGKPVGGLWCFACGLWKEAVARVKRSWRLMMPVAGAGLIIVFYTRLVHRGLGETLMGEGRTLAEAQLFSEPMWSFWNPNSVCYVGWAGLLAALAGFIICAVRFRNISEDERRFGLLLALLLGAVAGIAILAAGPFGPWRGRFFVLARAVIPHYIMIRQPAKIMSLLPSILALAGGIGVVLATYDSHRQRWRIPMLMGVGAILALEYGTKVQATICLLDKGNSAYQAIAEDARDDGRVPRALAIVLWPGDSHYTSIYQYYALLYRVRLVNGYSPSVRKEYFENVFKTFESMNQGHIEDAQLDALLAMNVDYLILHQNLYPAKVSPFRVAFALKQMLNHARLELMTSSGPVWAFRILREPKTRDTRLSQVNAYFPTRVWTAAHLGHSQGRGAGLSDDRSLLKVDAGDSLTTHSVGLSEAPGLRWMLRLRGRGAHVRGITRDGAGDIICETDFSVDTEAWTWFEVPLDAFTGFESAHLEARILEGGVEASVALVAAGEWTRLEPGGGMDLPAAAFFHDGYMDIDTASVRLRKTHERADLIFHGPDLPIPQGRYAIEILFDTEAAPGVRLGEFAFDTPYSRGDTWYPVVAGDRAAGQLAHHDNLPFRLVFRYARAADMTLHSVRIRRLE